MEKCLGEYKLVTLRITNGTLHSCLPLKKAEVGGSNPTRSISFILVNYGIDLRSFFDNCRTKPVAMPLSDRKEV
jgi:hypothetical protein